MSSLVSCITPTYNRRAFWPRCVQYFLSQDYPNLEWVVVDNGTDPIYDLLPKDARINYVSLPQPKMTHGELMNICCSSARGEYLIVWDDDDWYAPDRISRQVAPFDDPNIDVTGTGRLYYYLHGTKNAYRYQNWTVQKWIGAIALRKSVWETKKFSHIPQGADVFMLNSIPQERWKDLNDLSLLVAAIHPDNKGNGKNLPNMSFIETPWEEIQTITKGAL